MAWRFLCTTHLCEGNVFSVPIIIGGFGEKQGTRSMLKTARTEDEAHHLEQQDMLTMCRVTFWELEYAILKDGNHQQKGALTVQTLSGAGRPGAVREVKNLQCPTANADGPQKRSRRKSSATPRRSGASCTRTCRAKMTLGQTWAWTMPKQLLQYNRSWRTSFGLVRLGRTKMEASQKPCLNKLAGRLFAMTRSNWGGEPNERHISNKGLHRNRGIVSIAVEL